MAKELKKVRELLKLETEIQDKWEKANVFEVDAPVER